MHESDIRRFLKETGQQPNTYAEETLPEPGKPGDQRRRKGNVLPAEGKAETLHQQGIDATPIAIGSGIMTLYMMLALLTAGGKHFRFAMSASMTLAGIAYGMTG